MVILSELLPGSSSSSSSFLTHDHDLNHNQDHRYDVFVSFRGADTRDRFTDHLYNALLDAGFITFLDDEEIETGEPLKPELESAIKSSRASVIVLSKNYASSTWCLDELVLILEQKKNYNQIVIPIFYDVEPTHVRKQQSSFGEAMEKHKQKMEAEIDEEKRSEWAQKMELWKRALKQVADLKGKDNKHKKENEFIKEVVADIHRGLGVPLSNTLPLLIGMDYEIRCISSWLTDGSCHTADILTIAGIGGIGKTSLAKFVFQLHSSKFHKNSFIEGINTRCKEKYNGLLDLQKQLHTDISGENELKIHDVSVYILKIKIALARKRVFIVLDDIGSIDQLDALLGNKGFHPGSKIIITTKDASLTERCALFNPQVQPKHKMVPLNGLYESKSLDLLCIHAFKSHDPKEGYEEVSEELVKYCQGHPLALEVLGRSLQEKDVAYWEECIQVIKKESVSHINAALKMSFDALPYKNDKELFKHIACFFVGTNRDVTETILIACGIKTRSGITNLIEKCLLRIGCNNELIMHQLVQEMGRDLVRQESPEKPWMRSRLWCHEDSLDVLKQKKRTENLVGLALDMRMLKKENLGGSLQLETDAFSKMDDLKLLQLNYAKINGSCKDFPRQLIWLCMHGFPLKSIPSELPVENLVVLDMSHSNIETFYMSYRKELSGSREKDKPLLGSLKILDLSYCEQLRSVCGFSELPTLQRLIVRNCISLVEVCGSLEQCVELVHIDLSYCYKLKKVPISLRKLKKVETLLLDGCSSCESQIETIPSDLKLVAFSLPSSLRRLSLSDNNLCNKSFPMDFSCLSMLEELCLDNNPIVSMPNCVRTLPRLRVLSMNGCEMLISVHNPPRTLTVLAVSPLYNSSKPELKTSLRKIKFDPGMSPLNINGYWDELPTSVIEIDGLIKIQPMADVGEKVLHSLGWTNLDFIKERRPRTSMCAGEPIECETQIYYEFGIFSTLYDGKEMPEWIRYRTKGPELSFTIPSSPNKVLGLNFCYLNFNRFGYHRVPRIKISNPTKNHTWIYTHHMETITFGGDQISRFMYDKDWKNEDERKCLIYLTHWMFGPNEMKGGDHITITLERSQFSSQFRNECGIGLVYDDEDGNSEETEDVLGYYKSWNHIIGGDLSHFQLTTGEYILHNLEFVRDSLEPFSMYALFTDPGITFKEERVAFKAFSEKKKSEISVDFNLGSKKREAHKSDEKLDYFGGKKLTLDLENKHFSNHIIKTDHHFRFLSNHSLGSLDRSNLVKHLLVAILMFSAIIILFFLLPTLFVEMPDPPI